MKLGATEEKTGFIEKPGESRMFNVSVRGWLAILIIGTACFDSIATTLACISTMIWDGAASALESKHLVDSTRYIHDLALIALGYYFGKEEREHLGRKKPVESMP